MHVACCCCPPALTLSNLQASSASRHLAVMEAGSPRPQQPSGSSAGPSSSTAARTASAAARRTAWSLDHRQPRMPLAEDALPDKLLLLAPPPLPVRVLLVLLADVEEPLLAGSWPSRWLRYGRKAEEPRCRCRPRSRQAARAGACGHGSHRSRSK